MYESIETEMGVIYSAIRVDQTTSKRGASMRDRVDGAAKSDGQI